MQSLKSHIGFANVKIAILGLAVLAALSAAPALAASPELYDNNSAWCCARVAGRYFTTNDWARVDIYENGQLVNGQWTGGNRIDDMMVQTSGPTFYYCPNGWLHLCSFGGTFTYEYVPHDQCFNRYAIATDVHTNLQAKPVSLMCS